jgi:hypothetical protein
MLGSAESGWVRGPLPERCEGRELALLRHWKAAFGEGEAALPLAEFVLLHGSAIEWSDRNREAHVTPKLTGEVLSEANGEGVRALAAA